MSLSILWFLAKRWRRRENNGKLAMTVKNDDWTVAAVNTQVIAEGKFDYAIEIFARFSY